MRVRHIVAVAAVVLLAAGQGLAQDESFPPDDIHIRLERTPCQGKCPTYTIDIDGNGRVAYEGIQWVSTLGKHTWQVPEEDVVDLVNRFLDAHFFDAAPACRADEPLPATADGVARAPGARLTLNLGAKSHTVLLSADYPEELALLPMNVDDAAQVAGRGRSRAPKGSAVGPVSTQ
jgi:hypothetical protein